jgi:Zn-dependent protease
MTASVRLGRIAGIPVGVHWSLFVVAGLLTASLASGLSAESDFGASLLIAALGALLFFGSVLAHEVSHAVVARRHGVEVEDITLWVLGGVARLRSDASTPRAHLEIAVVGPVVSFLAGIVFLGIGLAVSLTGADTLAAVLLWLALVNGVLAVFNLLPGAPLDGGRVLAAALWMRHGDRARAELTAARAGRFVGSALIALGLANLLFGWGFGTIWTALVGWFVVNASLAEEQAARARSMVSHLSVRDLMDRHPAVVPEWVTVDEVLRAGLPYGADVALLQDHPDGNITGVVTLEALRAVKPGDRASIRLHEAGTGKADIVTAAPSDPAGPLFAAMLRSPVVVLEDGRVAGVVSVSNIVRSLHDHSARGAASSGGVPVP